jgi:hypothetical protein
VIEGDFKVGDVIRDTRYGGKLLTVKQIYDDRLLVTDNSNPNSGGFGIPAREAILVSRPNPAKARRAEQSSAQSLEDLIRIGHRRGMANPRGWARHVLAAREAKRGRVVA